MKSLPESSLRGAIRAFIVKHRALLGDNVLEVGTRQHNPKAWWVSNRDLATGKWIGVDIQRGPGVDEVADICTDCITGAPFSSIICSEVLEHTKAPWKAIKNLHAMLAAGGHLIVTVPFAFPIHSFPSDYFRISPEGLRSLFEDAGFTDYKVSNWGSVPFAIDDHGEGLAHITSPMHTFGIARKCT